MLEGEEWKWCSWTVKDNLPKPTLNPISTLTTLVDMHLKPIIVLLQYTVLELGQVLVLGSIPYEEFFILRKLHVFQPYYQNVKFSLAWCKGETVLLAVLVINCKLRANFLKFCRIGLNVAISTMSTCAASLTNFLYRYKPRVIWTRSQVHTWVVRIPAADFVSAARISKVRYPVIVFDMFIGHIYARYNIVLINTWLQIANLNKTSSNTTCSLNFFTFS